MISWNGAASYELDIIAQDASSNQAPVGTITMPAATGTVLSMVDAILTLMPAAQPYLAVPINGELAINLKALITGTDVLTVMLSGGDF